MRPGKEGSNLLFAVALRPRARPDRSSRLFRILHGADCERISGIVFGSVVDSEVATENGPRFGGVRGIRAGGPIVLRHDKGGENRRLEQGAVAILVGVIKEVRVVVFHPVGETLHFVPVGHPPAARLGAVRQSALAA